MYKQKELRLNIVKINICLQYNPCKPSSGSSMFSASFLNGFILQQEYMAGGMA